MLDLIFIIHHLLKVGFNFYGGGDINNVLMNFCNEDGNDSNLDNGDDSDDDNNFNVSGGPDQLLQ